MPSATNNERNQRRWQQDARYATEIVAFAAGLLYGIWGPPLGIASSVGRNTLWESHTCARDPGPNEVGPGKGPLKGHKELSI